MTEKTLNSRINHLESELQIKEQLREAEHEQIEVVRGQVETLKKQLEQAIEVESYHKEKIGRLETEIFEKSSQIERLELKVSKLNSQLEAAIQGQGFLENDIHKQRQDLKELLESEKRDKRLLKDKYKEMEAMLAEAHEKHDQQLQSLREHLEQVVSELEGKREQERQLKQIKAKLEGSVNHMQKMNDELQSQVPDLQK